MSWSWIWFIAFIVLGVYHLRYEVRVNRYSRYLEAASRSMSAVAAHKRDAKKVASMYLDTFMNIPGLYDYQDLMNEILKNKGFNQQLQSDDLLSKDDMPELHEKLAERIAEDLLLLRRELIPDN